MTRRLAPMLFPLLLVACASTPRLERETVPTEARPAVVSVDDPVAGPEPESTEAESREEFPAYVSAIWREQFGPEYEVNFGFDGVPRAGTILDVWRDGERISTLVVLGAGSRRGRDERIARLSYRLLDAGKLPPGDDDPEIRRHMVHVYGARARVHRPVWGGDVRLHVGDAVRIAGFSQSALDDARRARLLE